MSVRVMSWVFEHSQSKGNDRLMLLAIADRCDDDGGNCWKSTETLAKKAKVSKRTAQRCIDHLVALGELSVVERVGLTSVLSVVIGGRQVDAPTDDETARKGGVNLSPVSDRRGVTLVTRGGVTVDARYIPEPSTTPQPPASGGRKPDHCERHTRHRDKCDDCRHARSASRARPPWCGSCNEATRIRERDDGSIIGRCPTCHPKARRTA